MPSSRANTTGSDGSRTGTVQGALRRLFPPGVAVAVWDRDDAPAGDPEEEAPLARAVPARVAEFRRGRACARAALAELGVKPAPIPAGKNGEPIWPAGVVGSIAHCRGLVAAVVARRERVVALGLDVEPVGGLPEGTRAMIVHPLDVHGEGGAAEKVVFSAKESIYKALFPRSGEWLDFLDVVIELDERSGRFRAVRAPEAAVEARGLEDLRGAWVVAHGFVMTAAFEMVPGVES